MARTGRPQGHEVNPDAVADLLAVAKMTQAELCIQAGVSKSHLTEMLRDQKGAGLATIKRMAQVLRCQPGTIAPSLTNRFVAVRRAAA